MNLYQTGDFTLASGAKSRWKIECDSLSEGDWNGLAHMAMEYLHALQVPFSQVVGVPTGGNKFAEALRPFCANRGPVLIVDDVLTTGGSMNRMKDKLCTEYNYPPEQFVGLVYKARGPCFPISSEANKWIHCLFQMPRELWVKPA